MIFRPTQRLAKKIKPGPLAQAPLHDNPYADWSASLFIADRLQYVLLVNTVSLYSAIMPGRGVADDDTFIDHALDVIRYTLTDAGLGHIFTDQIAPHVDTVQFAKPLNRSVTGSMTEMVKEAKFLLEVHREPPADAADQLSHTPLRPLATRQTLGPNRLAFPDQTFPNLKTPE